MLSAVSYARLTLRRAASRSFSPTTSSPSSPVTQLSLKGPGLPLTLLRLLLPLVQRGNDGGHDHVLEVGHIHGHGTHERRLSKRARLLSRLPARMPMEPHRSVTADRRMPCLTSIAFRSRVTLPLPLLAGMLGGAAGWSNTQLLWPSSNNASGPLSSTMSAGVATSSRPPPLANR